MNLFLEVLYTKTSLFQDHLRTNKMSKTFFTKRNLVRYYYSLCVYTFSLYVVSFIPGVPTKFLYLYFWKCHILPPKTKLQHAGNWRRKDMILLGEKMICSCYPTVQSAKWLMFSEFLIFCKLFHKTLGEWNNSKIWETRKILANIAR